MRVVLCDAGLDTATNCHSDAAAIVCVQMLNMGEAH
jgi:hypothetical protein